MKKTIFIITSGIFAFLLTGCGNLFAPGVYKAPAASYNIQPIKDPQNLDPWSTDPHFTCSGTNTVRANDSVYTDGTDDYSVCTSTNTADYTDVLVHGRTQSASRICFFPAVMTSSGDMSYVKDPASGLPAYNCSDITSAGAYFSFPTLAQIRANFNAAFIVEDPDGDTTALRMQDCLKYNFSSCPSYSFGQFR